MISTSDLPTKQLDFLADRVPPVECVQYTAKRFG